MSRIPTIRYPAAALLVLLAAPAVRAQGTPETIGRLDGEDVSVRGQINLVREAENTYDARQSWLELQFHNLGHWMIATGERLHKRYHAPEPLPRRYQSSSLAR